MNKEYLKYLYIINITFLLLGFVSIYFALFGFLCMLLPITFLFIRKDRKYCQNYCPRSKLNALTSEAQSKLKLKNSKFITSKKIRRGFFIYFMFNMLVIVVSTYNVYMGNSSAGESVNILMMIKLGEMPQLVELPYYETLVHLSYRMYSMILTTTVIGTILAVLYKPKTWCAVCPITTVSQIYINHKW